jgi:hypothetical protein
MTPPIHPSPPDDRSPNEKAIPSHARKRESRIRQCRAGCSAFAGMTPGPEAIGPDDFNIVTIISENVDYFIEILF